MSWLFSAALSTSFRRSRRVSCTCDVDQSPLQLEPLSKRLGYVPACRLHVPNTSGLWKGVLVNLLEPETSNGIHLDLLGIQKSISAARHVADFRHRVRRVLYCTAWYQALSLGQDNSFKKQYCMTCHTHTHLGLRASRVGTVSIARFEYFRLLFEFHIHVYGYIQIRKIHTYMYIQMPNCMHIHTHIYMNTHIYTSIYIHIRISACDMNKNIHNICTTACMPWHGL